MTAHQKELLEYTEKHGRRAACKHFKLSNDSLKRSLRRIKGKSRKPLEQVDEDKKVLIDRISERFSPKELKALLDDTFRPQPGSATYNFDGETIKIGVLADIHFGSKYTNPYRVECALEHMKKDGVKMVVMPGDISEGMSGRDGHVLELTHIGYQAQRDGLIELLSLYTKDFDFYAIAGNHDLWFAQKANMGALIVKDVCDAIGAHYLGEHEGILNLNGVNVMLWHGGDGSSYALSYRLQKIIESFTGGEKPQMLIAGHAHKAGYFFIRNIHAFEGGCIQSQTPYMRGKKLAAHEGFWILEPTIADGEIKRMKSEFIPYYI